MEIVTNLSEIKTVLKDIAKKYKRDLNNIYIDKKYKYIITKDNNILDFDFLTIDYLCENNKINRYKVKYISGCFYPYLHKQLI